MKNFLIRGGNITGIGVILALMIGLSMMIVSFCFFDNQNLRIIGASIGLAFVSFAGYSARATTLGINLFDNSYKKARESYQNSKEETKDEDL